MKKNKNLIILLLVAVMGVVGVTIAYFSSTTTFENEFQTAEYGTTYIEKFVSPENWLPGDETEKTLEVRNSGSVDEAVRVKVEESWISKSGTHLSLKQGDNVAALINFINDDDWTQVTVDGEDYYYYYYNYKLAPGETTSKLLDKVTFNPLINASTTCSDTVVDGTTTRVCNSNWAGYDDATYTLTLTVETVQYNKYNEVWNTDLVIKEEKSNPLTVQEFLTTKTNPVTITNYIDGNIHEMYTFNHVATTQTPILTDYRYIGNDPYNYVYFNCDDLDNQNSETCEVWRIIGVFDVEREIDDEENPGQKKTITETRMKLIRGSDFLDKISWDSNQTNDWTNASLKTHLNKTYYNRLSSSAQSQIEDAIYYLGGKSYDSTTHFGSTEKVYAWERGSEVYNNTRPTSWEGKIALMYPSDMYMTYANGVDDLCYNDPYYASCRSTTAINSWIYNTNTLDGGSSIVSTWFLSPYSHTGKYVLIANQIGVYDSNGTQSSYGVRPVLYLSSNVKITSGDGSINSPYKLGL